MLFTRNLECATLALGLQPLHTAAPPPFSPSFPQVVRIPPWPATECFYGNYTLPAATTTTTNDTGPATVDCGAELVEVDLTLTGGWVE